VPNRKDKGLEHQQPEHVEVRIDRQSLYHPPWRDRLPDGTLGPWYGPMSAAEYLRQLRESRERSGKPMSRESKYDAESMQHFYRVAGHTWPLREQEIYMSIYVDGKSIAATARRWELKRDTVRGLLGRLRRRLQEYLTEMAERREK